MTKHIGIIGCGWLGLPVAENLREAGHTISGTTTSEEKLALLTKKGIQPFKISISEDAIKGPISEFLASISVLVINIPPGLRGKGPKESYVSKIKLLYTALKQSKVTKVVFVSSTSVYGAVEGTVTEQTLPKPNTESGKQLLKCEQLFQNDEQLETTVIRFGGLIGPNRHPVTMLFGKINLSGGSAPVNLIHLNDCVTIIKTIIEEELWNTLLNGVYPAHPTKEAYYTKAALARGLTPPHYRSEPNTSYKLINNCSLFLTKYEFYFTSII